MDLTRVILGPIVTEKAERLKATHMFTFRVHPEATKVDIKNALRRFFDCTASSVRIAWIGPKYRPIRRGVMCKRDPFKKATITLAKGSKPIDLALFHKR
ncbi:50S ribosomal protein L23 [Candidatus Peribacteria bacterium RIFCSPHIGHO2_01_FULL_51_9]|nr:MAG: 50S ribosomal protein L23 [Candidatus Peribacteria bacterium RIFCSPHIGHO2_01_FULL_51_9]